MQPHPSLVTMILLCKQLSELAGFNKLCGLAVRSVPKPGESLWSSRYTLAQEAFFEELFKNHDIPEGHHVPTHRQMYYGGWDVYMTIKYLLEKNTAVAS